MNDINVVNLTGNIGKTPELLGKDRNVLKFSLAVNEFKKNETTQEYDKFTSWVRVIMFGRYAEETFTHLGKGMRVGVFGKMRQNVWTDQKQVKHYEIEVVAYRIEVLIVFKKEKAENETPAIIPDRTPPTTTLPPEEFNDEEPTDNNVIPF
jgi:single-strand DNA-binding protein